MSAALPGETPAPDKGLRVWGELTMVVCDDATVTAFAIAAAAVIIDSSGDTLGAFLFEGIPQNIGILGGASLLECAPVTIIRAHKLYWGSLKLSSYFSFKSCTISSTIPSFSSR